MAEANVLEGCELVEAGDAKRCTERERRPFRPLRGIEARRKLAAELDQDIHEKASRRPDEYDVAGIRKCWDPTPFHQSRIPAAMVGMKMGTKDIINLFRHNTGCCQSIQKSADVAAMPVRKVLAGLIVANATIDKNGVVPGTNQIALNGENNAAGSRGYRPRCEPMEMWLIASSVLSGNYSDGVRRGSHISKILVTQTSPIRHSSIDALLLEQPNLFPVSTAPQNQWRLVAAKSAPASKNDLRNLWPQQ